jgi:hypothetical protein
LDKFFFCVFEICKKFLVFAKNLSSLSGIDVEVILLWRLPENSVECKINVMREKFQDRRKVLFSCEL